MEEEIEEIKAAITQHRKEGNFGIVEQLEKELEEIYKNLK